MVTFEKYKIKVIKEFKELWPSLSDEEVNEYFEGEGEETTREDYERYIKRLKNNEITEDIFMHGCVGSTAYELSLMY
ncbi:hypothetical protein [Anaerococcus sp. Marseille-P9784]|uniref:hypothetical protein n=1 Tax=Anaerococcus sp. Marseille-P9784 TaxID=2614127 RepID=UPI00124A9397|nr:hypothetical protein [Anaerococcus sp. Marseille-P9784]